MPATSTAATESSGEVVITRVFDAPRALVFKAWTQPKHLVRWWGPHGAEIVHCEMDLRVGGAWHIRMRGAPHGGEDRQRGVIREIVEPQRLVFSYAFENETGERGHETIVTVTFADEGEKTRLTVHQAIFESLEVRDAHIWGWGQALDDLADYIRSAASRE
jgi:uncharacterized protein YndB with AHSA1/START domain